MSSSSFTQKVYEVVSNIPTGKVLTYGDVAKLAGSPGASRAVGMVMKNNPDTIKVPCHRVVASNGAMHGYSGENGVLGKKSKLHNEGVFFKGDKVDLSLSRFIV